MRDPEPDQTVNDHYNINKLKRNQSVKQAPTHFAKMYDPEADTGRSFPEADKISTEPFPPFNRTILTGPS
jgi:hypothetical protein